MAAQYADVSNAFRQPNVPDTYVSLFVEALTSTGTPYSVPQPEAFFIMYITTRYPLFMFDLTDMRDALARSTRIGMLEQCTDGYTIRADAIAVNPCNSRYTCPRLGVGKPVITTALQLHLPPNMRSNCGRPATCGGGTATVVKACAPTCNGASTFGCNAPTQGCCPAPAQPCTPCCP